MGPIAARLAQAQQLPNWQLSASAVSCLVDILGNHSARIPSQNVQELLSAESISVEAFLQHMMLVAQQFATKPISDFPVGAAALGESGDVHLGANFEFVGLPLNFSVHAEQACLSNALLNGETQLCSIALSAAPCGHCRQFLFEQRYASSMVCLLPGNRSIPLVQLLPQAFGPQDLGVSKYLFERGSRAFVLRDVVADPQVNELAEWGLSKVQLCHAPYSASPSVAILETADGETHAGVYLENAAFNPSLPPLQSALARLQFSGSRDEELRNAILLEVESASISHWATTQAAWRGLTEGRLVRVTAGEA